MSALPGQKLERTESLAAFVMRGVLPLALFGAGALVATSPLAALAVVGATVALALLARAHALPLLYLRCLGAILVGYAFLGKGFAYAGKNPVYVGELVLGLAVLTLLRTARVSRTTALHLLILCFVALGAARTLPYIGAYGTSALRDGSLWGYTAFAAAVSYALRPEQLARLLSRYRRLMPAFLLWTPLAAMISLVGASPHWPGSGISLVVFKGGDFGVHLAIAAAFVIVGLYGAEHRKAFRSEPVIWVLWLVGVAVTIAMSRGAILALASIVALLALLHFSRRILQLLAAAAAALVLLLFVNPSIPVGHGNVLSPGGLAAATLSIVKNNPQQTTGGGENLQGSKDFRIAWWKTIVDYTVHGPYFWSGKGFGVNLADSDGFQVTADDSLRAPHNTTMTVLARMGVPGLVLWILLQGTFAGSLLAAFRRARRQGALRCAQVDAWVLAAWLAMMVDTSFDPYLEGPQGSIWFWAVVGVGIALVRDQRRDLDGYEQRLRGDAEVVAA